MIFICLTTVDLPDSPAPDGGRGGRGEEGGSGEEGGRGEGGRGIVKCVDNFPH